MKHFIFKLTFFLVAITFISCEGNTTYEWKIKNDASNSIFLEIDSSFVGLNEDTILSGETKTILIYDKMGGSSNSGDAIRWGNLLIYKLNDTLVKNTDLESNWTIFTEQRHKIPSDYYHEFTFKLNDSDF